MFHCMQHCGYYCSYESRKKNWNAGSRDDVRVPAILSNVRVCTPHLPVGKHITL